MMLMQAPSLHSTLPPKRSSVLRTEAMFHIWGLQHTPSKAQQRSAD